MIFLKRKHLLKYAKVFVEIENQNIGWQKKSYIRTRLQLIGEEKRKREILELSDKPRLTLPCHQFGLTYSKFIASLKEKKIELDRKVSAQLAKEKPEIFEKIVKKVKA